jgi:hypothetical protein
VAVDVNTPAVYYSPEDYGEGGNAEGNRSMISVEMPAHLNRNLLNRVPFDEPQLMNDGTYRDVLGNIWIREDEGIAKKYHGGLPTYRGTGEFRGSQGVYVEGVLLNYGPWQGTFDFWAPYNDDGSVSILRGVMHMPFDVLPHIDIWLFKQGSRGYENTPDSNIYGKDATVKNK